ncbi:hypothetical protein [Altererythrobacter sp. Root672]|uniref:hypothetical protein n=1 Tax=Altererythrobacter sp. Root672 TaxID=1736584 RepID=UPI000700D285|nr:hypothetical protein [Altererythrobacter sp. Root672]KRA79403.1 hypothetical protein ASD76_17675 [Altererythrobacter sp. Root672]
MKLILLTAGCTIAAASVPASAQEGAGSSCYIQVPKLVAAPPGGIDELGSAIRKLDEALRPQVEEVNRLKAALDRLQATNRPQQQEVDENGAPVERNETGPSEEEQHLRSQLSAKQDQLKSDYAARQAELVGPVQARISQGAQTYGNGRGCSQIKMARSTDLPGLQSAGAQDITAEFVTWYGQNGAT